MTTNYEKYFKKLAYEMAVDVCYLEEDDVIAFLQLAESIGSEYDERRDGRMLRALILIAYNFCPVKHASMLEREITEIHQEVFGYPYELDLTDDVD